MAMAITHFAIGGACTALSLAIIRPTHPFRGIIIISGGLWGLLPDIHWVSPVLRHELHMAHRHLPILDIFWFHRVLDSHPMFFGRNFAAIAVVVLFGAMFALEVIVPRFQRLSA